MTFYMTLLFHLLITLIIHCVYDKDMRLSFQLRLLTARECAAEGYLVHSPRPPPDPDFRSLHYDLSKSRGCPPRLVNANFTHDSSSIALQLWLLTAQECATEDSRSHLPRPPPLPDPDPTDRFDYKYVPQREYVVYCIGFIEASEKSKALCYTGSILYCKQISLFGVLVKACSASTTRHLQRSTPASPVLWDRRLLHQDNHKSNTIISSRPTIMDNGKNAATASIDTICPRFATEGAWTEDLLNGFDIDATLRFDGLVPECHLSRFVICGQSVAAIATAYTKLLLQREQASLVATILCEPMQNLRNHSSRRGIKFGWKIDLFLLTAVFLSEPPHLVNLMVTSVDHVFCGMWTKLNQLKLGSSVVVSAFSSIEFRRCGRISNSNPSTIPKSDTVARSRFNVNCHRASPCDGSRGTEGLINVDMESGYLAFEDVAKGSRCLHWMSLTGHVYALSPFRGDSGMATTCTIGTGSHHDSVPILLNNCNVQRETKVPIHGRASGNVPAFAFYFSRAANMIHRSSHPWSLIMSIQYQLCIALQLVAPFVKYSIAFHARIKYVSDESLTHHVQLSHHQLFVDIANIGLLIGPRMDNEIEALVHTFSIHRETILPIPSNWTHQQTQAYMATNAEFRNHSRAPVDINHLLVTGNSFSLLSTLHVEQCLLVVTPHKRRVIIVTGAIGVSYASGANSYQSKFVGMCSSLVPCWMSRKRLQASFGFDAPPRKQCVSSVVQVTHWSLAERDSSTLFHTGNEFLQASSCTSWLVNYCQTAILASIQDNDAASSPVFYFCSGSHNSLLSEDVSVDGSGISIISAGKKEYNGLYDNPTSARITYVREVMPLLCIAINEALGLQKAFQKETKHFARGRQFQLSPVNCLLSSLCNRRYLRAGAGIPTSPLGKKVVVFMAHAQAPAIELLPSIAAVSSSVMIELPALEFSEFYQITFLLRFSQWSRMRIELTHQTSWTLIVAQVMDSISCGGSIWNSNPNLFSLGWYWSSQTCSRPSCTFTSISNNHRSLVWNDSEERNVPYFFHDCKFDPSVTSDPNHCKPKDPSPCRCSNTAGSSQLAKYLTSSRLFGVSHASSISVMRDGFWIKFLCIAIFNGCLFRGMVCITPITTFMLAMPNLHSDSFKVGHCLIGLFSSPTLSISLDLNTHRQLCDDVLTDSVALRWNPRTSTQLDLICTLLAGSFPCSKREKVGCCADTYSKWCALLQQMLSFSSSRRWFWFSASACQFPKHITIALVAIGVLHTSVSNPYHRNSLGMDQWWMTHERLQISFNTDAAPLTHCVTSVRQVIYWTLRERNESTLLEPKLHALVDVAEYHAIYTSLSSIGTSQNASFGFGLTFNTYFQVIARDERGQDARSIRTARLDKAGNPLLKGTNLVADELHSLSCPAWLVGYFYASILISIQHTVRSQDELFALLLITLPRIRTFPNALKGQILALAQSFLLRQFPDGEFRTSSLGSPSPSHYECQIPLIVIQNRKWFMLAKEVLALNTSSDTVLDSLLLFASASYSYLVTVAVTAEALLQLHVGVFGRSAHRLDLSPCHETAYPSNNNHRCVCFKWDLPRHVSEETRCVLTSWSTSTPSCICLSRERLDPPISSTNVNGIRDVATVFLAARARCTKPEHMQLYNRATHIMFHHLTISDPSPVA